MAAMHHAAIPHTRLSSHPLACNLSKKSSKKKKSKNNPIADGYGIAPQAASGFVSSSGSLQPGQGVTPLGARSNYSPTNATYGSTSMAAAAELAATAADTAAAAETAKKAKPDPQIGWRKFAASEHAKTWLTVVTDAAPDPDGREPGLYCSLCSEFGKNSSGERSGKWITAPSTAADASCAQGKHAKSVMHKDAISDEVRLRPCHI